MAKRHKHGPSLGQLLNASSPGHHSAGGGALPPGRQGALEEARAPLRAGGGGQGQRRQHSRAPLRQSNVIHSSLASPQRCACWSSPMWPGRPATGRGGIEPLEPLDAVRGSASLSKATPKEEKARRNMGANADEAPFGSSILLEMRSIRRRGS